MHYNISDDDRKEEQDLTLIVDVVSVDRPSSCPQNHKNKSKKKKKTKTHDLALVIILSFLMILSGSFLSIDSSLFWSRNQTHASTTATDIISRNHSQPSQPSQQSTIHNSTNTTNTSKRKRRSKRTIVYSIARTDRSGSFVQDMLMCHAYAHAFAQDGWTYGGACPDPKAGKKYMKLFHQHLPEHLQVIESLGLTHVLQVKMKCPTTLINATTTSTTSTTSTTITTGEEQEHVRLLQRQEYRIGINDTTRLFTKSYLQYLKSLITVTSSHDDDDDDDDDTTHDFDKNNDNIYHPHPTSQQKQQYNTTIAVHIRRGDITPCRNPTYFNYDRYLPNDHYLRLISRYHDDTQKQSKVVIYSESGSFESFQEFKNRGYQVVLDGPLGDVWKGMVHSDILITSRSSFSLIPAILTSGKVIWTPFWLLPLPEWEIVNDEFIKESQTEFLRLQATCPPPWGNGTTFDTKSHP